MKSVFSSNHKSIGTNYLVFAIIAGVIGVVLSLAMRLEMNEPGIQYFHGLAGLIFGYEGAAAVDVGAQMLALFSSAHALVMIFFMVVPALFGGFSNWLVPMMIGTSDMAFPRLNRASYLMLFPALALLVSALFFAYSPITASFLMIAALHVAALSALLTAVNFIATIISSRAPGMGLKDMPVFVWSVLVASFLMIVCMPVMTAAVTMVLGQYAFSASTSALHDVPQLQVMMWFFTHPEIYVLILPAFGIVSQVVATFAGRPLFAEKGVAAAMVVIGCAGFILWTQNLFHSGAAPDMRVYFYSSLPVIALPASFIVLSWLVTMWQGKVAFTTPMLWAIGFALMFVIGMVSAAQLALADGVSNIMPFVAHFHYVLSLGAVFAIFSGWYFWFPKMSGCEIRSFTGKLHFWIMFIAVNLVFLPQHFQGFDYATGSLGAYVDTMFGWSRVSTLGAVIAAFSLLIFFYGIVEAFIRRKPVADNPWGAGAMTLEWQLSSPPPHAQWQEVPILIPVSEGDKGRNGQG